MIPKNKRKHVSKHQPHGALAVLPKQEVQNVGNAQMVSYQMLMVIRKGILKSDYYHSLSLSVHYDLYDYKMVLFYFPTENKTTIYKKKL